MSTQQRVSSNIDHPYVRGAGAWFAAALLLGAGLASNGRAADVALPARPVQPATGRVDIRDFGASGSEFTASAAVEEGKTRITVNKPGDFLPGQGVTLSPALIRYDSVRIYEPDTMYKHHAVTNQFELRGFDGKKTNWRTFVLDFAGGDPSTFRWSNDMAFSWTNNVAITGDWQPLSDGVEIRFRQKAWLAGHLATFHARTDLVTTITAVNGNEIELADAPNVTGKGVAVRHHDRVAIERALKAALDSKHSLYIPSGHYRLDKGFTVPSGKAIWIEGEDGQNSWLDIGEGSGAVFNLAGDEVTLLNLKITGNGGWKMYPITFNRAHGSYFWTMALRPSNAASIGGRRIWIENVHASKMSSECFYCGGGWRRNQASRAGTESLTFFRCTVKDVLFNAFNNNNFADNTSILFCVVDGAANFWEGPSRFVRCIGNHVRNCQFYGTFGGCKHRYDFFHEFGTGQSIIANNVFEGLEQQDPARDPDYNRRILGPCVDGPAEQVVIRDNIFVNFSCSTALQIGGLSRGFPPRNIVVSGNMIDLTHTADRRVQKRTGIAVQSSNVVVADNQIYVRGEVDDDVTGISVDSGCINVTLHDNIIRNVGRGIITLPASTTVQSVQGSGRFSTRGGVGGMEKDWDYSHRYRDWLVHWLSGANSGRVSEIAELDTKTLILSLKEPLLAEAGDGFAFYPKQANWLMHHNTITDCRRPAVLEGYGSATSLFTDNVIARGLATGVPAAVTIKGDFTVGGNRIAGFDEAGSAAVAVQADARGKVWPCASGANTVIGCAREIAAEEGTAP